MVRAFTLEAPLPSPTHPAHAHTHTPPTPPQADAVKAFTLEALEPLLGGQAARGAFLLSRLALAVALVAGFPHQVGARGRPLLSVWGGGSAGGGGTAPRP